MASAHSSWPLPRALIQQASTEPLHMPHRYWAGGHWGYSTDQALFSRIAQEDAERQTGGTQKLWAGLFRSIKEQHLDQLEGPRKAFLRSWRWRLSWRMFRSWPCRKEEHSGPGEWRIKGLDTVSFMQPTLPVGEGVAGWGWWGRQRTQHSLTCWEVLVLKAPESHNGYAVHGDGVI